MKWSEKEVAYLKNNPTKSHSEIGKSLNRTRRSVIGKRKALNLKRKTEIEVTKEKQKDRGYRSLYEKAVKKITELENEKDNLFDIQALSIKPREIRPTSQTSESTAIVLLSDWHYEEVVKKEAVNLLNEFNQEIADARIIKTFQTIVQYLKIHQKETEIKHLVLSLLGDFISGGIHDDLKESNSALPIMAIWQVQNHIVSGINHILEHTDVNLIITCSPGNHTRITPKQRVSTEHGNSLEWLMYLNLAKYYESNKRVDFIVSESYHTYLTIYDYVIRFHHGHNIRYLGGVGGIYIPVNKAIAQWNKGKKADLDCFGHFHQLKDGGTFICNGSLIGWNAFAIRIKADYEKPKQTFFLLNKKHFVNVIRPIVLR